MAVPQTGTANERIGQQAVDLADARKTRDALREALRDVRRLLENDILPRMAAPVDPLGIAHGRVQEAITTIQAAIEKAEVRR